MRWVVVLVLAGCAATPGPYPGFEHVVATADFEPPVKYDPKFDWIMLKSGEWLKGEITVLRDQDFEFESEELDTLSLDWDDVHEVRTKGKVTCAFDNPAGRRPNVVTGRVTIDKEAVRFADGMTYLRSGLISLIPGEMRERNYWSGKLTLNATARAGNTDQSDLGTTFRLIRRSPYSRLDFNYNGALGTVGGEETVNNHRATATWDVFVTKRLFVSPIRVEFYSDVFQNIRWRVTPSTGLGYHVVTKKGFEWDVSGGVGWQFTRFASVQPGEPEQLDQSVLQLGTAVDWDLTSKTEIKFSYTLQLGIRRVEDSTQHLSLVVETDIWKDFDFDVGFYWDWVGDPATDAAGETPENSDFRLTVGIGWDF